jgi:P4 family phage/plasmid primase-like protien
MFRPGRRDDYISMCTGVDYYPYDKDLHDIKKVESILSEIFVEKELMDYVLTVISKCLVGEKEEVFYILNGSGSNGKSVSTSLIENSFGDYAGSASVALLTQKRNRSSAPSPDLVMLKGKRIVSMHEPENDDELKVGLMKQMSGGDKIQARALHKAPIEYVPQFKMFMNCNKLPKISANDDGTWRRMRVIEFKSKFLNKPDPKNKLEFKRDNDLMRKIDLLGSAFMSILVKYYELYRKDGIEVPDEVMKFTNEYKQESDVYTQFIDEMITITEDSYMSVDQLKGVFDIWWSDNMTEKNKIKKIEFRKVMISKIGKCVRQQSSLGWKVKINNLIQEVDELE